MSNKLSRRDFLKLSVMASGAAALAACAPNVVTGTSAPGVVGTKKLVFSSYTWGGYEEAINKVIDSWLATQPAGSVEVERQYADQSAYWEKVQTQVAAGTPPDCGMADFGRLLSYAKNGTLLNITDMVKNASDLSLDKMMPGALAQYRWKEGDFDTGASDGDYYGLPADAQAQVFAYNKKMFDAASVAYPTDDWTWDDLRAAAIKLTDPAKEQFGFFMDINEGPLQRQYWLKSAGASLFSADYKKSAISSPETTEAFTWLWNLIWKDKAAMGPIQNMANTPFMDRKVAMTVAGIWWATEFNKGLDADEWDAALLPKHPKTGKRTMTLESDGFWVFKGAKEPELAFNLVKYFAGSAAQQMFMDAGYVIPSDIPDIANPWYAQKPDGLVKVLENLNTDSAKNGYTNFESATINSVVAPIILTAFADGSDIAQALKDADAAMNGELATAWELFAQ